MAGQAVIPSTWCVVHPDGRVEHQAGDATHTAIRKALGGYTPTPVALEKAWDQHVRVWRADVLTANTPPNPTMASLVAGHQIRPIIEVAGRIVVSGVDGAGIPEDILDWLDRADKRARAVAS